MILPEPEEKLSPKFAQEMHHPSSPSESPPPYSPPPQALPTKPTPPSPSSLPPDLPPANYVHIKEKNGSVKRKILLDLNLPRPPASALPVGVPGEDTPHLLLDSHNGAVSGEAWILRAAKRPEDPEARELPKSARERVRLYFGSHNGSIKALVHVHPSTVEPRPFLSVEVRAHNGGVTITIPRSFRGQLTLHTDNGRVHLSSAVAARAAALSAHNGTHTYFVGERPSSGTWHTDAGDDGEEVDGVIGSSKNGSVKISFDDEDWNSMKGPGVFSSLFKAMGF